MIASINRRQLITGCLILVAVVWTIDMVSGGAPRSAQASLAATGSALKDSLRSDPPDRAALERFLFADDAAPQQPPFERVRRDPFVPPPKPIAVAPVPPAGESPTTATPVVAEPNPGAFAEKHRLDGVIFGRARIALVNGVAVRVGQTVDGCRLERIERDFVIFDVAGESVELRLPAPQRQPPR